MIEEQSQSNQLLNDFGSSKHPIGILDDEQEKSQFSRLVEESRNQAILKQALLCRTSLDITFAIIKTKFRGTFQQKDEALRHEIDQYFCVRTRMNLSSDNFYPKFEGDYENQEAKPIGIALIVYGVDFMDTKKVGGLFSIPGSDVRNFIHKIQWIDDSNCKIVFFSPQNTQLVLEHLILDIQGYKLKAEEDGGLQIPRGWFQLKPYNIYGIERRLYARYATMAQLQVPKREEQVNRYVIFENAQRLLQLHLLTKFNAFQDYENLTKLMNFQNYKNSIFRRLNQPPKINRELTDTKRFQDYVFNAKKLIDLQQESGQNHQNYNHISQKANPLDVSVIEGRSMLQKNGGQSAFQDSIIVGNQADLSLQHIADNSFLQQLDKNPRENGMVQQNFLEAMMDESEEHPAPVEHHVQHSATIPAQSPIRVQPQVTAQVIHPVNPHLSTENLVNKDVVNMLASNQSNSNFGAVQTSVNKSDKYKLSSQQFSVSIAQPSKNVQEQSKVQSKPAEPQPLVAQPQAIQSPAENRQKQNTIEPQQMVSKPIQSQNVKPFNTSTQNRTVQKPNQVFKATASTSQANKGRVLPTTSKNDHYEPDSY